MNKEYNEKIVVTALRRMVQSGEAFPKTIKIDDDTLVNIYHVKPLPAPKTKCCGNCLHYDTANPYGIAYCSLDNGRVDADHQACKHFAKPNGTL